MATYKNPWHRVDGHGYGPAAYETEAKPVEHAGYLIYQRVKGCVWDVVKDGVCITQRAGMRGAMEAVQNLVRFTHREQPLVMNA